MSAKCSHPSGSQRADMQLAGYGRSPLNHGHDSIPRLREGPVRREHAQLVMEHDFDPPTNPVANLNHPHGKCNDGKCNRRNKETYDDVLDTLNVVSPRSAVHRLDGGERTRPLFLMLFCLYTCTKL